VKVIKEIEALGNTVFSLLCVGFCCSNVNNVTVPHGVKVGTHL
jgi:hypothetical protein